MKCFTLHVHRLYTWSSSPFLLEVKCLHHEEENNSENSSIQAFLDCPRKYFSRTNEKTPDVITLTKVSDLEEQRIQSSVASTLSPDQWEQSEINIQWKSLILLQFVHLLAGLLWWRFGGRVEEVRFGSRLFLLIALATDHQTVWFILTVLKV